MLLKERKENGAKRAIPLKISGPFHSALMKPAAEKFQSVLNEITIQDTNIPVIANVTADVITSGAHIQKANRTALFACLMVPIN